MSRLSRSSTAASTQRPAGAANGKRRRASNGSARIHSAVTTHPECRLTTTAATTHSGGNETFHLGAGNDRVTFVAGHDTVFGEAGADTLVLDWSQVNNRVYMGNDPVANAALGGFDGSFYRSSIGWYASFDSIEHFEISTGGGDDTLVTATGNDIVSSGDGHDDIYVGSGNDTAGTVPTVITPDQPPTGAAPTDPTTPLSRPTPPPIRTGGRCGARDP